VRQVRVRPLDANLGSPHYRFTRASVLWTLTWEARITDSRRLALTEWLDTGQARNSGDHQAGEQLHSGHVAVVEGVVATGTS